MKFMRLPQLIFEYVRGGALENHDNISANEGCRFSVNCSRHLHVSTGTIRLLHIEISSQITSLSSIDTLATFMSSLGTLVSRESRDPTTVCSSWRYAAPEILNERDRRDAHHKKRSYTLAVDIWSLGVTVFECVYDLPSKNATGVSWSQEIVKKLKKDLQRNLDDLKQLLWDTMVIMTPEQRQPAQYCPLLTRIALRLRLQRLKPRVINDQWANTALQTTMAQISQPWCSKMHTRLADSCRAFPWTTTTTTTTRRRTEGISDQTARLPILRHQRALTRAGCRIRSTCSVAGPTSQH